MSKNIGEFIDLTHVNQLDRVLNDKNKKLLCVNDDVEISEKDLAFLRKSYKNVDPKNQTLKNENRKDEILLKRRIFTQ